MVIKDETGEIPWGRMFGVQKWVRAPRLPTGVFNGGLQVPASFLDYILDARITGWLVLDWLSLLDSYGFIWTILWISVLMKFIRA